MSNVAAGRRPVSMVKTGVPGASLLHHIRDDDAFALEAGHTPRVAAAKLAQTRIPQPRLPSKLRSGLRHVETASCRYLTGCCPDGHADSDEEKRWSGRRDSNSRHQPWQGCTLPAELLPPEQREPLFCPSRSRSVKPAWANQSGQSERIFLSYSTASAGRTAWQNGTWFTISPRLSHV